MKIEKYDKLRLTSSTSSMKESRYQFLFHSFLVIRRKSVIKIKKKNIGVLLHLTIYFNFSLFWSFLDKDTLMCYIFQSSAFVEEREWNFVALKMHYAS